jgi:hypothetical protein
MRDAWTALPDRLLRECADRCRHRLGDITDAEWFWEPVPGCWSVRPGTEATTKFANGRGEWVVDYDLPEPDPAPFTTIGWRVLHLTLVIAGYLDVLDGYRGDVPWDEYEIPGTAQGGIAFWESQRKGCWPPSQTRMLRPSTATSRFPGGVGDSALFGTCSLC